MRGQELHRTESAILLVQRAASYARPSQWRASFRSRSEQSSKTNHRVARITVVETLWSALNFARMRGPAIGNLNARESADPIAFVRGSTAKICFPRYNAVSPNMAREETRGHAPNSSPSAAAQAFISSEIGDNLGCGFLVAFDFTCRICRVAIAWS